MKNRILSIAILIAIILGFSALARAADPYNGVWANKVKIKVTNPTVTSAANYPVRINVPAKTYIDAGLMNSDMRDVRFADSNGYPLPFMIGITVDMKRTINNVPVYVKLKTFNSGDNYIYMYYDVDVSIDKNTKTPKSNYTASDVVTDYCGNNEDPPSSIFAPYSKDKCGDNVFGTAP